MHNLTSQTLKVLVFAILVLILTGCCSPGVKPGDANLFQAGCGVTTGQYEEGLQEKQDQLHDSRKENTAAEGRIMQLETTLVSRKQQHKSAQDELIAIESNNQDLSRSINTMRDKTNKDRALKQKYMQKLQHLNDDIEALKNQTSKAPDEDYLNKIQALKQEVETLRIIVLGQ